MTPVLQRQGRGPGGRRGDCLRACIASVLDLPLDDVPDLMQDQADHDDDDAWLWTVRLAAWLAGRGLRADYDQPDPAGFYIIWGACGDGSPTLHACVAQGRRMRIVHDPHPRCPGIARIYGWISIQDLRAGPAVPPVTSPRTARP